MTAYHHIYVATFLHYVIVGVAVFVAITYVRYHHHIVGKPGGLEILRELQRHGLGIGKHQSGHILVGYHALRLQIDAHKGYALIAVAAYMIRHKCSVEWRRGKVVVCRQLAGFHVFISLGKFFYTIVELVVAKHAVVIAYAIVQGIFYLATKHREIHRSLHGITGMHSHHILIGSANAVYQHFLS